MPKLAATTKPKVVKISSHIRKVYREKAKYVAFTKLKKEILEDLPDGIEYIDCEDSTGETSSYTFC